MKKTILVILTCLIVQLFNCSTLFAQEEIDLGEIVVTGAKIEKPVKDLPFSANVLSTDEISKRGALTVDQAVRSIPGVHSIRSHPSTHGVFVTMRGHALTKQVVALDGQPINDGFNGYVRWGVIPQEIMENIEVIRGPFSVLYGSYGMGGVINFTPKTVLKENEFKMQIGSFGVNSYSLLYSLKFKDEKVKDKLNLTLSVIDKDIGGYVGDFVVMRPAVTPPATSTEITGWKKTSTSDGKLAYKIGDRGRQYSREHRNFYLNASYLLTPSQDITLTYLYGRQKHGFEGGKTYLRDATGKPINSGNVKIVDGADVYYITGISLLSFMGMHGICGQDIFQLKYSNKLRENIKIKFFTGFNTRVQKWATPLSGATESGGHGRKGTPEGTSTRLGAEIKIKSYQNTFVAGIETVSNSGSAKREKISDWLNLDSAIVALEEEAKGKSRINSIYFLNKTTLKEKISIWGGGRYDSWKNYDGKTILPNKITSFPDKTVSRFSPKLGILIKPQSSISVRTSYGEGFRMPTSHELYRQMIAPASVSLGNPDLKEESNAVWDIGVEFSPKMEQGIKTVKVNYFNDKTEDLIYIRRWTAPHPDTGIAVEHSQRENAGKAKTTGWEIELEGNPIVMKNGNVKLNWFANISLQKPKITENFAAPITVGKYIPYIPRTMYNIGINAEKNNLLLGLLMHRRGDVYLNDDNSDTVNGVPGSFDPFTVIDATFGWKLNEKTNFSFTVNNLFDKQYFSMHNQLAPGRSTTGKLEVKF